MKPVKYLLSMIVTSLAVAQVSPPCIEKMTGVSFHKTEPHWEEFYHSDYDELNREKGTAAVTGTNTVLTFGENNSNWLSLNSYVHL